MSRLPRPLTAGATILATAVVLAACGTDTDTAGVSSSTQPETVTTLAPTTTATTQPAPTTTTVATTPVALVEGNPYRQPNTGDPSTVDIYLADTTGRPAVVLLHGWATPGGSGPDVDLAPFAQEVARLGSTVFYFRWATTGGFSADSAADLRCIGPFMGAHAAEYGADPNTVVVIGHSMGGETGSKLALSSFGLTPGADCVTTGDAPTVTAFLGIGGSYGLIAQPLDDDLSRFAVRPTPRSSIREIAADEFVRPGLTALDAYAIDGYSALPSTNPLRMVLLVGSNDQYPASNPAITAAFAEALEAYGTDVEVIEVPGAGHENVMYPHTDAGQTTLQVAGDILNTTP